MPKAELKRKGSSRKSKGKGVPPPPPQQPQGPGENADKKGPFPLVSKHPRGEGVSPVYNEPYSAQQEHPAVRPLYLDLNHVRAENNLGIWEEGRALESKPCLGRGAKPPCLGLRSIWKGLAGALPRKSTAGFLTQVDFFVPPPAAEAVERAEESDLPSSPNAGICLSRVFPHVYRPLHAQLPLLARGSSLLLPGRGEWGRGHTGRVPERLYR